MSVDELQDGNPESDEPEILAGYWLDANNELQPVVQGVLVATGASGNSYGNPELGKRIQDAMTRAVEEAQAEGITDPEVIKERMQLARQMAKRFFLSPG